MLVFEAQLFLFLEFLVGFELARELLHRVLFDQLEVVARLILVDAYF